jgi:citrate synthase
MTETAEAIKIQRGLKGVYFDRSPCTFIDGKAGELRYRGYSIHDLAEHSSFEETAWLLLRGELPSAQELGGFDAELKSARKLPVPVLDIIAAIKSGHPMDVLRTAVSALAVFDPDTSDNSREATLRKGVRLTSQVPMIVAAHTRIRAGLDPLPADATLGQAANLLWMLRGEKPSRDAAQLIDRDLILHAEHGSNASSFAARVVIGTEANLHAAITAAIAALSGPAHGAKPARR